MRKDLAETLGYPCNTVPLSDGTVIDLEGLEVRNEKARHINTYQEAQALEHKLSRKIKHLRSANTTPETG